MLIPSLCKKLRAMFIYIAIVLAGANAPATAKTPPANFPDVISKLSVISQARVSSAIEAEGFHRAPINSPIPSTDPVASGLSEVPSPLTQASAKVSRGPTTDSPASVTIAATTPLQTNRPAVLFLLFDDDPGITAISPLTGIAGTTTVTITGYDFSIVASENLIAFSGVTTPVPAATVTTTATGMQLTVVVPINAPIGTGPVTVTVNGQVAVSPGNFTVQAPCTGLTITSPTNYRYASDGSQLIPSVTPPSSTPVSVSAPTGCAWSASVFGTVQTIAGAQGTLALTTSAIPNGAVSLGSTSGTGSSNFSIQMAQNSSSAVLTGAVAVMDNSPVPAANKVPSSTISLLQKTSYPLPPGLVAVPLTSGAMVDVAVTINTNNVLGGALDHYQISRASSTAGPWSVVNANLPGPQMFSPYSGRVEYVDQVDVAGTMYYQATGCTAANLCSDPTSGSNGASNPAGVVVTQSSVTLHTVRSPTNSVTTVAGPVTAPEQLYTVRLQPNSSLAPLKENAFGEQIDPANGTLSFLQQDAKISGIGPDIEIYRSFGIPGINQGVGGAFFDWDLELPRITTNVTEAFSVTNGVISHGGQWTVGANHSVSRCSAFGLDMSSMSGLWYTEGVQLVLPGHGAQEMMLRASGNAIQPGSSSSFSGVTAFPLVTTQHWQIGCLSSTANGQPGEAFLAVAPDGTQYWFDNLVYDQTTLVSLMGYDGSSLDVQRYKASMLVTKIRDRFGNTVHFVYGGPSYEASGNSYNNYNTHNLVEIWADDGRDVKINYNVVNGYQTTVSSITVQPASQTPRTWTYSYGTASTYTPPIGAIGLLQSVTLPDGSAWKFNLSYLEAICDLARSDVYETGSVWWMKGCVPFGTLDTTTYTGSITSPSGLVGSFSVQKLTHSHYASGTSNGGRIGCTAYSAAGFSDQSMWYAYVACTKGPTQQHFVTPSLVSKTYSGAGLGGSQTWSYSYSPSQPALSGWAANRGKVWVNGAPDALNRRYDASGNPYPSYTLSDTSTATITNPDSSTIVSTFDNRWDTVTDGDLLTVQRYDAGHNLLSQVQYAYASSSAGPYPAQIGSDPSSYQVNAARLQVLHPQQQVNRIEAGDTYTWAANSFDSYGRPMKVTSSSPGNSIVTTTAYFNDTGQWVLGQLQSVTNVNTSEVMQSYVYGGSAGGISGLLSSRSRFGLPLFSYQWNADGTLASFADGNNHATTLSSYKRGIPQTVTFPDFYNGSHPTITSTVDDFGQVTSVTDQNGATTKYGYDGMGRVTKITYPTGDLNAWNDTLINYSTATDGGGNLYWQRKETRGAMQKVTTYDAKWQPTLTVTSDSNNPSNTATTVSQSTGYDWRGNVTFNSYPQNGSSGGSTGAWTDYDVLSRVTAQRQSSELGQLTTTTQYLSGVSRKVTDPNGNITITSYLAYDEPDYSLPLTISSPEGVSQTISRDPYGNPLSITQSGTSPVVSVTRSYTYDSYKRLCRLDDPETGSEFRVYDSASNLIGSAQGQSAVACVSSTANLAANALVSRTYDEMNRVKTIVYPSGTNGTSYTYDGRGKIKTATSGIASWSYDYTNLGPLQDETLSQNGGAYTLDYSYNNNANLSQIEYPDGTFVGYSPDALGRPTQAGSYASNVQYFADGKMSGYTLGNGVQYAAQENARQILQNLKYAANGVVLFNEGFSYDKNANLKQVTDSVNGSRAKTMTYDGLDRLKSIAVGWGNEAYTYDGVNNLLTMSGTVSGQSESLTYTYNALNRLSGISGTSAISYTYDARGNVRTRNSATLTFDVANRLTSYSDSTTQANYWYDAHGRRTQVTSTTWPHGSGDAANTSTMVYSQNGKLMYETDNYLGLYDFVYLNGQFIAETITSAGGAPQTLYRQTDHLGSPIMTTDANGGVIAAGTTEYRPYGVKVYGSDVLGPGFTGHFNDTDSKLTYMQARYYDPAIGRFISADPAGLKGGFNTYAYVGNNPLGRTDPTGLYTCSDGGIGGCGVVAQGLATADEAAKSGNLSQAQQAKLTAVVNAYGAAGVDNGVHVTVSSTSDGTGGSAGKDPSGGEKITIDVARAVRGNDGSTAIKAVGRVVVHEGQHVVDDQNRGREINSYAERHETEVNAYTTEAYYQQAEKFQTKTDDGWTFSGGINAQNIEKQAKLSIQAACGSSTSPSCSQ